MTHTALGGPRGPRRNLALQWLSMVGLVHLLVLLGCSSEGTRDTVVNLPDGEDGGAGGGSVVECEDEDGDGFGKGCLKGPDCDDGDERVTDDCYRCAHDGTPGCACDTPDALAECGQVLSRVGDQITCGYGVSTCSEGVWGPCIINNSAPLSSGGLDGGVGNIPQAIGGPSPTCVANPCDPYCQAFDNDTPDGITGDNIVSTDAGITLNEGSDIPVSGTCTGGKYGNCGHSICEVGPALTWGCDSDNTSCGTPTTWDSVDADEAVNQPATDERHVTWTPSWPSVEAADQIDPIGTAGRYTVYTPTFPSVPAGEPVNQGATDDRWLAYTPTFPNVPASSVLDPAATDARYQHYDPVWPTAVPNEIVGDPGTGSSFYDPRFPSVNAVEVETGDAFANIAPNYPPLAPSVTNRGNSYDLIPPSFPSATPVDGELGVNNYVIPPYPGVSPSEVSGGGANYTDPTPGTTAPIGGAEVGSACGGVGTPHVGGSCSARPRSGTTTITAWTAEPIPNSAGWFKRHDPKYTIPAGTYVDVIMTRTSGNVDADLHVRITGTDVAITNNRPQSESGTLLNMPGQGEPPTVFHVFPGGGNVTGDVSTASWHCRPYGTGTESCRFYMATEAQVQFGVSRYSGSGNVRVELIQQSMRLTRYSLENTWINARTAVDILIDNAKVPVKRGSVAYVTLRVPPGGGDADLWAARSNSAYWDCQREYQLTAVGQTKSCLFYADGFPSNNSLDIQVRNTYYNGFVYHLDVAIFDPDGDCGLYAVGNDATNQCCVCASGESTAACPADQCGTKCPAGQEVCNGDRCCGPKTCPAGYVMSGNTCVWNGLSCTGAVCGQGSCEMISGAPKCKIGCEGGSSHVCSDDPSKCCSYTCPAGYSLVSTGPNTWACQAITTSCTTVANNACATVPGGGWACDASGGNALCRKSCENIVAGSHACAGNPYACCESQCPNGYTLSGNSCIPITNSCTPLAQTLCADLGASCVVEGGQAVCKKDFACQDRNANWHACGTDQCCESTCSNPDYGFDASSGQCKPKTDNCTNTAQSACAAAGGSCQVLGGAAQCRVPVACPSHKCEGDSNKCCAWECQTPEYDYLNTAQSPPVCENRDCSLEDVCDAGDICEDSGDYEHPDQQCRRFDSCPEGTFLCQGNRCCTYECPAGWTLNSATMLCEQRSCGAPGVCNAGDVCVDSGPYAGPNQQCRHDTGTCVGGTHACGESCCNYSCSPEPSPGFNYPNGAFCERRDCGLCTELGDQCAGATAEAGCMKDRGCGGGSHACGSDPTQCCDYTCPPPGNPDFVYASGSRCEKRDCDLCASAGDECFSPAPAVQCRRDNGCAGGSHECSGGACCKATCPPPGMPDFDVHVTDPIFGERCEYHGCDLCGTDECLGSTADSGCAHDYGCGAGTFPCADDPTKCCNAVCPPAGFPDHNVVNGKKCEKRDCSGCPDGTTCTGTAPNIQCCGGGVGGGSGCVAAVCNEDPRCCSDGWSAECVALAKSVCDIDCIGVGPDRACAVCYKDDIDHDGDGYSWAQGDCMDCTTGEGLGTDFINPGAFDVPGNGIDDDCSGTVDDEIVACDQGLSLASANAFDYARAMDLCRIQPPAGKWGVVDAKLVRSDAKTSPGAYTYGIMPNFGAALLPQHGQRLAAFSTGTARRPGDSNFVKPKKWRDRSCGFFGCSYTEGSRDWGYTSVYPQGYPVGAGCPRPSGSANDSSGLWMQIRVPTNAKSFTYNLDYYSSEYPEWVCSKYNDSFVALLTSDHPTNVANAGAPHFKNISFDGNDRPINVNNNYFVVTSQAGLAGSGFDGTNCWDRDLGYGQVPCGAATGWLTTSAPVTPGELITVHFTIWDTTDHIFDSTILLDNWQWSTVEQPIQTQPDKPGQPFVAEGSFVRDYDASQLCADKPGTAPRWARWNWTSQTPSTSKIEFYVSTASTAAGLATAEEKRLLFDDVSGWPANMRNKHATAKRASTSPAYSADTQSGSTTIDHSLQAHGLPRTQPFLRIRSRLMASDDYSEAPLLQAWSLEFDCLPSQ